MMMMKLLLLLLFVASSALSQPLSPPQSRTLFRLRRILGSPPQLSSWTRYTDLCSLTPPIITCNSTSVTSLHLSSNATSPLPDSFSSDSLFVTLSRLPSLTSLSLTSLGLWGPLSPKIHRLHSLSSLNLSDNFFTGPIPTNLLQIPTLTSLDLSNNRLSGTYPCSTRSVKASGNHLLRCSSTKKPLAAILPPRQTKSSTKSTNAMAIVGGVVGGVVALLVGILVVGFLVLKRRKKKEREVAEVKKGKAYVQVSPRSAADARHMSQAVRIGTLGVAAYRVFTLEEVEEVTNGFDAGSLIEDGAHGKFYKGWLPDGSTAVVRCLKLKQKYSAESLTHYMDIISKLRHVNIVSILGHCVATGHDNANTVFLVMEYVSNGTLRSHLTEWRKREMLKWPQRVSAVIGVARGIQFLHTVTVPGIVGNDLKIDNILLDQTLTAKISNYNLPTLSKSKNKNSGESPFETEDGVDIGRINSSENGEQEDVYQLGLILVEIITGKPAGTQRELDALKLELQEGMTEGATKLREITDPTIRGTFAFDSLQTLVAVTLNCLAKDKRERPSIDDILWNLQYSVQVQEGWNSSDSLSFHS